MPDGLSRRPPSAAGGEPGDPADGRVRFDLRLLESFVTLADELHFGRAARALGAAQPALTKRIRRLETQLGAPLVVRDSRNVELTAAGRAFLPHARASLSAAVEAGEAAAASARAVEGRLALSVGGDALDRVRELLRVFASSHPEVQLDLTLQFDDESVGALARRAVDAAILWSDAEPPSGFGDASVLLVRLEEGIALRETHPLACAEVLTRDDLRGQRLVMFPRERAPGLYDQILARLGGAGAFGAVHHITTIDQSVGYDMLAALDDASVTPSPGWTAGHQVPAGVVFRPLAPRGPSCIWLVWAEPPTPPTAALAEVARRVAAAASP